MMMMIMMVMIMINEIKQLPEFAFLKLVVADRNISKVLFSMYLFSKGQRLKRLKSRGPKDLQLEVGALRASRLLVEIYYWLILMFFFFTWSEKSIHCYCMLTSLHSDFVTKISVVI